MWTQILKNKIFTLIKLYLLVFLILLAKKPLITRNIILKLKGYLFNDWNDLECRNPNKYCFLLLTKLPMYKLSKLKHSCSLICFVVYFIFFLCSDDSQVINNIVKDVWQKLSLMYPNELKDLVQSEENNKLIESLLENFPKIGIWGMGGIGKTTIAKQMFAKYFAQYDSVCFLEKVREESKKSGLTDVRKKLLCELLKQPITASDVVGLHTFIKRRLNGKKVFIVLDDVEDVEQLKYLCKELDDLGPNSRLIITTRDKHTIEGRVDKIYKVRKWKLEESRKLFNLGAFKQSNPKEGYEHLSERAVAYAGGIPLALEVLGSHFYSRKPEFWESELNHLENKGESLERIR